MNEDRLKKAAELAAYYADGLFSPGDYYWRMLSYLDADTVETLFGVLFERHQRELLEDLSKPNLNIIDPLDEDTIARGRRALARWVELHPSQTPAPLDEIRMREALELAASYPHQRVDPDSYYSMTFPYLDAHTVELLFAV